MTLSLNFQSMGGAYITSTTNIQDNPNPTHENGMDATILTTCLRPIFNVTEV